MTLNVRDYGATGDNVTDDTAAFVAALASVDSKVQAVGSRTVTRPGGALDVPGGSYRLSSDLLLHRGLRLRMEPDANLVFDVGGLVLDSEHPGSTGVYTQAEGEVEIVGGKVVSLNPWPAIGLHCKGGGYSEILGTVFTGWGEGIRFDGSNGIVARGCKFSTWPGEGWQYGTGVRFALRPGGGGATNGCGVDGGQFNGTSVGIQLDDGAGCFVRDANFNAPGEVLQVTGAISFVMENCVGEGVTGDCYVRFGRPGGSDVERIVAQSIRIQGVWSRNEATATKPAPSIIRIEQNTQAWDVDIRGTRVLAGGAVDPVIACAEPWPTIPYVKFRSIDRRGVTVGGAPIAAWRRYPVIGPAGPVMSDRDRGGTDYGA